MKTVHEGRAVAAVTVATVLLALAPASLAQDVAGDSAEAAGASSNAAKSTGILPVPEYGGDLWSRSYLLGDLGGARSDLANKGIQWDVQFVQTLQSVVDGGRETQTNYGGTLDYNLTMDFDRMGLIPGGLLQVRGISRYGRNLNAVSGSIIPVNTDATRPTTSNANDDVAFWLPVINYTQFLSDKFAVSFGKYDTYDSGNEFAGGRGRSQWWNQNLSMPVSPALIIPYSFLGASAVIMPNPNLSITGIVGTSTDTSNRSGFNDLDDGMFGMLQISNQHHIHDLPGGFGLMYGYGWNGSFNEINGRINLNIGQLTPSTKDNTWFVSGEMWQYLWVEGGQTLQVNPSDGRQDLQGVGVFARVQFADTETNPLDYGISFGVNAKGLFSRRDDDAMGIAYHYNKLQEGRIAKALGFDSQSTVLEAFYNVEITPAIHLTLNAQYVDSALPNAEKATILGTSMQIQF